MRPSQSFVWTSRLREGVVVTMDDDTTEIIVPLCTRIGMIMEDACVMALTIGGLASEDRLAAILELDGTARRIRALVDAAKAMVV